MSLLHRIPPVLRARDFYLYTGTGRRLIDLWQTGGRAILGHKPLNLVRDIKNNMERGLFAPLPHPAYGRFISVLSRLFPHKEFRLYADEGSLRSALHGAGLHTGGTFFDPALSSPPVTAVSLWRPFIDTPDTPVLVPVLPWHLSPFVAVLEPGIALPPSEILSPVILAGATRALYDLIAAMPTRGMVTFSTVQNALRNSSWHCRGIYLNSPYENDNYEALFYRFLASDFLLPPQADMPAILPGILSPGEEAILAKLILDLK
jgi:hypothetical protein